MDSFWAGLPAVAQDYPDRVIVVGASTQADQRASFSNHNVSEEFVHVMAPGARVGVLRPNGSLQLDDGTSLAAPVVAGIAGLIRSFDPGLPVDSIKHYILLGAERGRRVVGGLPLANAYESLRAVAERTGAPLCGNRVWIENDSVIVARDTLGHRREALFAVPQQTRGLHALHGGKRIRFMAWPANDRLFEWEAGSWRQSSISSDSIWRLEGPVWRSEMAVSHDADSLLIVQHTEPVIRTFIRHVDGGDARHIGDVAIPNLVRTGSFECVLKRVNSVECEREQFIGSSLHRDDVYGAYTPQGDTVLLSVARRDSRSSLRSGWYICPGPQGAFDIIRECRDWDQTSGTTDAHVYVIPTSGSMVVLQRWSDTGVRVREIGVADGTREFYLRREGQRSWSVHGWIYDDGKLKETIAHNNSVIPCTTQFRRVDTGALIQERPGCAWTDVTIAPDRQAQALRVQPPDPAPEPSLWSRLRNWRAARG